MILDLTQSNSKLEKQLKNARESYDKRKLAQDTKLKSMEVKHRNKKEEYQKRHKEADKKRLDQQFSIQN